MRAQAAFIHLARLPHANQRCQIALKAFVIGAVQRDSGLRIRPGAVKQQRQAMMEQIGKRAQAGVLMMMNTLAGVLGHVYRQRAVRAKQAEAEDRHLMQPAFFPQADLATVDGAKLIDGCWPMRNGSNLAAARVPAGSARRPEHQYALTAGTDRSATGSRERHARTYPAAASGDARAAVRGNVTHISALLPIRGAQ
jgi:hypothetical protein